MSFMSLFSVNYFSDLPFNGLKSSVLDVGFCVLKFRLLTDFVRFNWPGVRKPLNH